MSTWNIDEIVSELRQGPLASALSLPARTQIDDIDDAALKVAVTDALTRPQPLDMSRARPVLPAVLAAQYLAFFRAFELPDDLAVYEPCVGASDPVIIATEAHSFGRGSYTTVNLNRRLRDELTAKIDHLRCDVDIIEADAENALRHLPQNSFDVACFHHAINDILQTAVATTRGLDTRDMDWWPHEREMIEWLAQDDGAGRLEERAIPALMGIIAGAARLVKPGGLLIFDHWTWEGHQQEPWFPWQLFGAMIPRTRQWMQNAELPLTEVEVDGADPQWWMVWRVD